MGFSFGVRGDDRDYVATYANMVDLRKDMATILKGFTRGNYACVTRCQKIPLSTLIVTKTRPDDNPWLDFTELHRMTFARNALTPFSENRLKKLRELVTDGSMALVSSYKDGVCLASILLETYKNGALYSVGAGSEDGLKTGAMVHAHYEAMKWARENGYLWYCMGSTSPSVHIGYGDFKKRFGGEKFDLLSGELVLDRQGFIKKVLLPPMLSSVVHIPQPLRKILRLLRSLKNRR